MPRMLNLIQFFCFLVIISLPSPFTAVAETGSSARHAWSGYWWPYVNGGLATGEDYRGHPAPLEKYELLTDGFLSGRLTYPYRQKYYDANAPGWYGLCFAWAAASSFENEPDRPSVHDNILFRVGDKKGLYTLSHTDDVNIYGDGNGPLQFHQWLTEIIGEQHKIFYADLDPGDEIWSYPIYSYNMTYGPLIGDQQAVEVVIEYASDFVTQDYLGTSARFENYTYKLTYEDGNIIDAQWMGASISNHPELMTQVQAQNSALDGLDASIIQQIGTAVDDEWETPGTALLPPGSYQMISLNQDRYRLVGLEGDSLSLDVEKLEGPENPLTVQVVDADGTELDRFVLTEAGESLSWQLSGALDNTYYVNLQQLSTSGADFYKLNFNRHSLHGEQIFPYVPANGWWNGFAITNLGNDNVDDLCLTSVDFSGQALQSHIEPQTLAPRSNILTLFSSLPARRQETSSRQTLALLAPEQVAVVNLFGGSADGLGGFFSGSQPAKRIQLPFSSANWSELTWGGVINRSAKEQSFNCSVYRADGTLLDSESVAIKPNQKLQLSSIRAVSKLPIDGWLDMSVESQEDCLDGYQLWRSLSDVTKLEAIRGLTQAQVQWVPHVEDAGLWSTKVTVINPQGVDLTLSLSLVGQAPKFITLGPHEKRVLSLNSIFSATLSELSDACIKIAGSGEFSAYVSYQTNEDLTSIPLLQQHQLTQQLALPHLSVEYGWWTGVVVFNPETESVDVTLVPVKADGSRWLEQEKSLFLATGGKKSFLVSQYWPVSVSSQFSHIEIVASNGQNIGGIFIFGRNGAQQVAGGILPSF